MCLHFKDFTLRKLNNQHLYRLQSINDLHSQSADFTIIFSDAVQQYPRYLKVQLAVLLAFANFGFIVCNYVWYFIMYLLDIVVKADTFLLNAMLNMKKNLCNKKYRYKAIFSKISIFKLKNKTLTYHHYKIDISIHKAQLTSCNFI